MYQYTTHKLLLYKIFKFNFPLPFCKGYVKQYISCKYLHFFLSVLYLKNVFTYMYTEKLMLCTVIRNWGFVSATRLLLHESCGIYILPSAWKRTVTTCFYDLLLDLPRDHKPIIRLSSSLTFQYLMQIKFLLNCTIQMWSNDF